jgi:hypothetical protein
MDIPDADVILGPSPTSAYQAAGRGEIPTIVIGRRKVVPVATLRRMLGLDGGEGHGAAA